MSQIENLEKYLQSYKDSLDFANRTNSKQRQSKYKKLIIETEKKLKELKRDFPIERGEELRGEINELLDEIKDLEKTNEDLTVELKEADLRIDKLINPEKYKEPEPEPVIEFASEPEVKIPCPDCGKMVKGEIGLRSHQSRWCKGEVAIS